MRGNPQAWQPLRPSRGDLRLLLGAGQQGLGRGEGGRGRPDTEGLLPDMGPEDEGSKGCRECIRCEFFPRGKDQVGTDGLDQNADFSFASFWGQRERETETEMETETDREREAVRDDCYHDLLSPADPL